MMALLLEQICNSGQPTLFPFCQGSVGMVQLKKKTDLFCIPPGRFYRQQKGNILLNYDPNDSTVLVGRMAVCHSTCVEALPPPETHLNDRAFLHVLTAASCMLHSIINERVAVYCYLRAGRNGDHVQLSVARPSLPQQH